MLDQMSYPYLFDIFGSWKKYSTYRLERQGNEWFVLADNSKNYREYDPYAYYPNILVDFLNIKRCIPPKLRGKLYTLDFDIERIKETKKGLKDSALYDSSDLTSTILNFVNTYGLLGLGMYKDNNPNKISYEMHIQKPLADITIDRYNNSSFIHNLHINNDLDYDSMLFTPKENVESISMFLDALDMLYRYRYSWFKFKSDKLNPDDIWRPLFNEPLDQSMTWNDYFNTFGYSKYKLQLYNLEYQIKLDFDNSWKLNYNCNSLFGALCLMSMFDMVLKYENIGICERCNRAFVRNSSNAKNRIYERNSPKSKYCSDTCSTYVRVKRYRDKNRRASEK